MSGRGFPQEEFAQRCARAQAMMAQHGLDALLLTTEPEVRYFTGYLTRFWESPSRPWFVVLPANGAPVAVIPAIGAPLMRRTWITDIRTWDAPDPVDEGVSLLREALVEFGPRIGLPDGPESHIRMSWADFQRLGDGLNLTGDCGIMARLRAVKSPAEIAKIETACAIATRAFDRVAEIAGIGVPLGKVFRDFQRLCLEEGADWVPYLAGGAGPLGYADVISPASETPLARGDVLMLDTGLVWDGYFCDFDRNFALGAPDPVCDRAYGALIEATQAGFEAAKAGATAADLYHAMDRVLPDAPSAGRLGHGLGMQLTEGISLLPWDMTVLEEGMVLTLEPCAETAQGNLLVHEENIVITSTGARPLTRFGGPRMERI